jgi:hypothetical protein
VLVRRDVGPLVPLGVTSSGALVASVVGAAQSEIKVGELDFTDGRLIAPPADIVQRYPGAMAHPVWSPDGLALAFVVRNPNRTGWNILAIHSMDTGETRELRPNAGHNFSIKRWSSDGRSLFVEQEIGGALYRVDAATGVATVIRAAQRGDYNGVDRIVSSDGRLVFYRRAAPASGLTGDPELVARDTTSGTERS